MLVGKEQSDKGKSWKEGEEGSVGRGRHRFWLERAEAGQVRPRQGRHALPISENSGLL